MAAKYWRALRELGPGSLIPYLTYQVSLQLGWYRLRAPLRDWDRRPLQAWLEPGVSPEPQEYAGYRAKLRGRFFAPQPEALGRDLRAVLGRETKRAEREGRGVLEGQFRLFGAEAVTLGFPPDWRRFAPLGDADAETRVEAWIHWSSYRLERLPADVKLLWEPGRFGWVYPLARAYALTGERRYYQGFWSLLESWREVNPPNRGLHWYSAQEAAIRGLALVYAFFFFAEELQAEPERLVRLVETIAWHAQRIVPTTAYARAQDNNHLLIESLALMTVGACFPELKPAQAWYERGRSELVHALRRQIFPDGGYVQYSANYHRLALQAALWALRLCDCIEDPLPEEAIDAIRRMTRWLHAMTDAENGGVPNIGPNDGAMLLPASLRPFHDHRPTLQAAKRLLAGQRLFEAGPWDDWGLWLGLDTGSTERAPAPQAREGESILPESGFYWLRGERTRGMLRAAAFHARPGHSDQAHFELWWNGAPLAQDPGTFLYNGNPPWDNPLSAARHHNTLRLDGREPMERAGRFLWVGRTVAAPIGAWRSQGGTLEVLAIQHHLDPGRAVHQRTVVRAGDHIWWVIDELLGADRHRAEVGWCLPDAPWRRLRQGLALRIGPEEVILGWSPAGGEWALYKAGERVAGDFSGEPEATLGWVSPTYALREPALRLIRSVDGFLPMRMITTWSLGSEGGELSATFVSPRLGRAPLREVQFGDERLVCDKAHAILAPDTTLKG